MTLGPVRRPALRCALACTHGTVIKGGPFSVARLKMDLPFPQSSRAHRRSASPLAETPTVLLRTAAIARVCISLLSRRCFLICAVAGQAAGEVHAVHGHQRPPLCRDGGAGPSNLSELHRMGPPRELQSRLISPSRTRSPPSQLESCRTDSTSIATRTPTSPSSVLPDTPRHTRCRLVSHHHPGTDSLCLRPDNMSVFVDGAHRPGHRPGPRHAGHPGLTLRWGGAQPALVLPTCCCTLYSHECASRR